MVMEKGRWSAPSRTRMIQTTMRGAIQNPSSAPLDPRLPRLANRHENVVPMRGCESRRCSDWMAEAGGRLGGCRMAGLLMARRLIHQEQAIRGQEFCGTVAPGSAACRASDTSVLQQSHLFTDKRRCLCQTGVEAIQRNGSRKSRRLMPSSQPQWVSTTARAKSYHQTSCQYMIPTTRNLCRSWF